MRNENDRGLIGRRLAPGEGIAGTAMRSGETLLISDVTRDERFSSRMDQALGFATRSIIAVPLRVETRTIGVIEIVNALGERGFDREDVGILESFADFAAIAISNAQAHSELLELTRNDPLSGLRNSTYFLSCVDDAVARGDRFAVLFSDMDQFKQLVDGHGHMSGSAGLAEVGRVFAAALAPDEVGCRFGGDEFAFLIPGADAGRAVERCRPLAALVAERTFLERQGIRVRLQASFGWTAYPAGRRDGEGAAARRGWKDVREQAGAGRRAALSGGGRLSHGQRAAELQSGIKHRSGRRVLLRCRDPDRCPTLP